MAAVDLSKYLAPGEDWAAMCDRVSGIMMYRAGRGYVRLYGFVPEADCPVHDCNGR